jgi:hypothetical protein
MSTLNRSFEEAIQVTPQGSNKYSANLRPEWCIGTGKSTSQIPLPQLRKYILIKNHSPTRRLHNSRNLHPSKNPLHPRPPNPIQITRIANLPPTLLPPSHSSRARNLRSGRCKARCAHKHNPHQTSPRIRQETWENGNHGGWLYNRQPARRRSRN